MTAGADPQGTRVIFPAASGERGWRRRERELATQVEEVCAQVRRLLGRPDPVGPAEAPSWETVTELADECVARLAAADPAGPWAMRLCEFVFDLYDVGMELCRQDVTRLERRMGDCASSLRRLRTLPSSADLVGQVCGELVGRCGFGRAGLSRVESGFWRPWTCFQSNGHEFVEAWFPEWVDQPIPIEVATPEIASVTDRRPVVVPDTATTTVYRPITIDGGRTISYVVAPVLRGGEVVAFLHADHCPTRRRVDACDGEVLGTFADGFGHVLEGVLLMERLREQRDQVWGILSDAVRSMDALCDAPVELSPGAAAGAVPPPGAPAAEDPFGKLTAREAEVFELMVAGATNGAIAERLVIAEDTVKSHVKHILRKLGVANRSQAIATSLIGGYPV